MLAVAVTIAGGRLRAQSAGEWEIKAAFLYKFASFAQWPDEGSGGSFCIGVLGQSPFGEFLDEAVKGKSRNGRPFTIKRFRSGQDVSGCQIVFISSSEQKDMAAILQKMPAAVLTVGDEPGFCETGGVIGFQLENQRVRLQVNLASAQREHIQLSSKLLSVAKLTGGSGQ
jgi:hypothetical protein